VFALFSFTPSNTATIWQLTVMVVSALATVPSRSYPRQNLALSISDYRDHIRVFYLYVRLTPCRGPRGLHHCCRIQNPLLRCGLLDLVGLLYSCLSSRPANQARSDAFSSPTKLEGTFCVRRVPQNGKGSVSPPTSARERADLVCSRRVHGQAASPIVQGAGGRWCGGEHVLNLLTAALVPISVCV